MEASPVYTQPHPSAQQRLKYDITVVLRCTPATWMADALEMGKGRNPSVALQIVEALEAGPRTEQSCLYEAHLAAEVLDREGFDFRPGGQL